jgi:hypothetical protein
VDCQQSVQPSLSVAMPTGRSGGGGGGGGDDAVIAMRPDKIGMMMVEGSARDRADIEVRDEES